MSSKKRRIYAGDFYWYEISECSPGRWVVATIELGATEAYRDCKSLEEAEAFIRGHNDGAIPERFERIGDEDVEEENVPEK